jgi:hypothetical protein
MLAQYFRHQPYAVACEALYLFLHYAETCAAPIVFDLLCAESFRRLGHATKNIGKARDFVNLGFRSVTRLQ